MKSTPYHASYYAHSLTLKHPSDDIQKLTAALGDARVDLNPHQVEAALFAFYSPLKKGGLSLPMRLDSKKLLRQD